MDGYVLLGSDVGVCLNSGQWSHPVPYCVCKYLLSYLALYFSSSFYISLILSPPLNLSLSSLSFVFFFLSLFSSLPLFLSLLSLLPLYLSLPSSPSLSFPLSLTPLSLFLAATCPMPVVEGSIHFLPPTPINPPRRNYTYGDQINIECQECRKPVGGSTQLTCTQRGQWNGIPTRCECQLLYSNLHVQCTWYY